MMSTEEQHLEEARRELLDARYNVQVKRRELRQAQERLVDAEQEYIRRAAKEADHGN